MLRFVILAQTLLVAAAFSLGSHATCGDGYVDPDEDCDDTHETIRCDYDCTFARCGDALANRAAREDCDDGTNNGKPGFCRDNCRGRCGDGIIQFDQREFCDQAADNGKPAACRADCSGSCGDGATQPEGRELCDHGPFNGRGPGYCRTDCSEVETGSSSTGTHLSPPYADATHFNVTRCDCPSAPDSCPSVAIWSGVSIVTVGALIGIAASLHRCYKDRTRAPTTIYVQSTQP